MCEIVNVGTLNSELLRKNTNIFWLHYNDKKLYYSLEGKIAIANQKTRRLEPITG